MILTHIPLDNEQEAVQVYLTDLTRKSLDELHDNIIQQMKDKNIHNIILHIDKKYPFLSPYAKTTFLKIFARLAIELLRDKVKKRVK